MGTKVDRTVDVCMAQPLAGVEVMSVAINVSIPFPEVMDAGAFYEHQAELIVSGLFRSLPQGTLERVLIKIMERRVSMYRGVTR